MSYPGPEVTVVVSGLTRVGMGSGIPDEYHEIRCMGREMKKLIGLLALSLVVLVTGFAQAGTLTVRDTAGFLTPSDVSALQAKSGEWPFNLVVLAENAPSFPILEDHAHNLITGPSVMVIAVDPAHHKVVTRFGSFLSFSRMSGRIL